MNDDTDCVGLVRVVVVLMPLVVLTAAVVEPLVPLLAFIVASGFDLASEQEEDVRVFGVIG